MTNIQCPHCKAILPIKEDDLIGVGRAQLKQEILELMEKRQNA